MKDQSRREFFKTAGCLTIGFSLSQLPLAAAMLPTQELPGNLRDYADIDAWLQVLADGSIRVFTGKLELGQGIRTAVAQVAAEELDMDLSKVTVTLAETDVTPNEAYTAGSMSVESSAMSIRYAAAAARQRLLEMAAVRLKVPAADLHMDNGTVISGNQQRLSFAEILDGKQLSGEIKMPVALKPKDQYRISGTSVHRDDVALMVKGAPLYVQDLRFPGMLHARVIRPAAYDAKLQHFDEQAVRAKVPGLLQVVVNGSFLAVIAKVEYEAMQAQQVLAAHTEWSAGTPLAGADDLPAYLATVPVQTESVREKGAKLTAPATHQASYFKPYIMHGATGPSCAVALFDKGQLFVWTHSQGVYPLRAALAEMLQLPAEQIRVKGVPGSGCYGHNGADDVAAEAALLAMAVPGKHVRLQWSRQEEHGWEPYGSAMLMNIAAKLDKDGHITHWQYGLRSDSHGNRPGGKAANLLPARYLEKAFKNDRSGSYSGGAYRNAEPYYNIPNQQVDAHFFKGPLRVSSLRSLGAFGNVFAIESFMDELAEQAGKAPFAFRLAHLEDERAVAVVKKLQELLTKATGTGGARLSEAGTSGAATGTGIGIAFARYKNNGAYCAAAAQVHVDQSGETPLIRVEKMWAVVDAGEIINPDGIKNQTEGGMVQAASWTLLEQVTYNTQHVTSVDWYGYSIFKFNQAPAVEVALINRPAEKPLGAGEAVQGPAAAAIANAVYKASGKRIRHLPITAEQLKG
ncbi:xanthine dehydrogenase family protein molybdopterin-binding subunit [Chitinophaga agrisoli]|uniref:Xanthine dehydrogenase family protein molybdopterin-binding subunit n=1 Tax=Chitinophaga agrisoli TaxID=2607653 RepID=A0A5B2W3L3_9BACT|nr:molybdopterin cofactor-binding domain-containing protein [Chitinophaga agrisoli]KAA2245438.1 xanthine dehydrogenase family protein molybdopterin-binding subunit [Chitinophaga agrisoli]